MAGEMRVLMLAAEMVPFAKTGGLADVLGALPKGLKQLGVDVRVAMPRYGRIDPAKFDLRVEIDNLPVSMDEATESVRVLQTSVGDGIPVYFVDSERYFNREGIYGYPDDGERFILYCRASLEMLKELEWCPDVIHCHDWHAGVVPNWLKTIYRSDPFWSRIASVFTIHNLQYQGVFGHRILEVAGIEEYGFLYHPQMQELASVVDLLARGIYFADVISTVSERYAREILTPEFGEKLDPLLTDRRDRLFGVLNGLDYDEVNPATDRYIATRFDVDHLERRIENKLALQREANLTVDASIPLAGMISRMVDQKGFDILAEAFDDMMQSLPLQFVLLGTGDQHYHNIFNRFAQTYPDRAAIFLTFNAALAQRIYAGADVFLMPSRFEPCGLGQLIGLRYGCIPVVRSTGGLADTVQDYNPRTGEGNGFAFERYHHTDLLVAVVRALENMKCASTWQSLQRRGMQADFSWGASAAKYLDLYRRAVQYHSAEQREVAGA